MKLKNHITILFWMLLGSAILVVQISEPPAYIVQKTDVEQSDSDDQPQAEQDVYTLSADLALNSVSQVTLHQELYQIREIIMDEVADPHIVHYAQKLTESEHFKTLFQNVISTNAP